MGGVTCPRTPPPTPLLKSSNRAYLNYLRSNMYGYSDNKELQKIKTPAKRSLKGVCRNQRTVGRSVGRAVGRSVRCKSCVANYFLSFFFTDSDVTSHRYVPLGIDVQDAFCDSS